MSGSSGTLARYLSSCLLNAFTEILVKFLSSAGRALKSRGALTDRHAYRMFLISVGALFLICGKLHLRPSLPPTFTEYIFPEVRSGICFSRIRHIYHHISLSSSFKRVKMKLLKLGPVIQISYIINLPDE